MPEGIDARIHAVWKAFSTGYIIWRDYPDGEYSWYYAENKLYVVRNNRTGAYVFTEARSPAAALENLLSAKGAKEVCP